MASYRHNRGFLVDSFFLYELLQDAIVYTAGHEEDDLTPIPLHMRSDDKVELKEEKPTCMPLKKKEQRKR